MIRLRQQATLSTRPAKELRPLVDLVRDWRTRAQPHLGAEPQAWVATLANRCDLPALSAADLEDGMLKDAATVVVDAVAARRATFTRSNVLAEALRQLHGVRFTTPHERAHAAGRVTAMALDASVQLTPPEVGRVPATLQRPDGSTLLRARDATIYTTTGVLQAEERLLAAGRATDGPQVPAEVAAAAAGAPLPGRADGRRLTAEQADAVCRVVTSGRALDVLVGAAGTGKSTTMAGVRAAWEAAFGRGSVVGLAPSAAAAEVLADAVGVPTENTAKWLTEQGRQDQRLAELASLQGKLRGASPSLRTRALTRRARQVRAELDRWRLRHGQLVIVDEASMAGTLELDTLTTQAREVGAKVLLVGDPAQLSPVAAGGAFRLLVTDRADAPELVDVRRFRHEWEAAASLALRDGQPTAAHPYFHHGRVHDGDRDTMIEAIYQAWRADIRAGRTSLMVAADAATVAELNARARADLVATGQVAGHGVSVADGTTIGTGDVVVTRLNQRDLHAAGGWVKNGDQWTVTAVHAGRVAHRPPHQQGRNGDPATGRLRARARRARVRHHRPPSPRPNRRHLPRLRQRRDRPRTALRDGHPRPRSQPALRRHQLRPGHRHRTRSRRPGPGRRGAQEGARHIRRRDLGNPNPRPRDRRGEQSGPTGRRRRRHPAPPTPPALHRTPARRGSSARAHPSGQDRRPLASAARAHAPCRTPGPRPCRPPFRPYRRRPFRIHWRDSKPGYGFGLTFAKAAPDRRMHWAMGQRSSRNMDRDLASSGEQLIATAGGYLGHRENDPIVRASITATRRR